MARVIYVLKHVLQKPLMITGLLIAGNALPIIATFESKTQIPEDIVMNLGGRSFGCDRCQEVCRGTVIPNLMRRHLISVS